MVFPNYLDLEVNYKGEGFSSAQIYKLIGGKVLLNYQSNPTAFANSCTLRMSLAFNKAGVKIPYIARETGSGADGNWYIYRVKAFDKYLRDTFGDPQIIGTDKSKFLKKKGIIQFQVSGWSDASGHFTLWDGSKPVYGDYFDQSDKVLLWVLS